MTKWTINTLALFLLVFNAIGQDIPIGAWRTHFSYNDIQEITTGNGKIICASNHGLFYVDPNSGEVITLSKTDGFSDVAVTSLNYDETSQTLVVAYESGLIDLFSNGKVNTIRDLNRSILVGSKKVNDVISNKGSVYAGCNFGILEISIDSKTIIDNFRSIGKGGEQINVLEMVVFEEKLFAISEQGIQFGELSKNLPDFNNWVHYPNDSTNFKELTVWDGKLYAVANDKDIAHFEMDHWEILQSKNTSEIKKLITNENGLYALTADGLYQYLTNNWLIVGEVDTEGINTACYSKGFWFGHATKGLETPDHEFLLPNGPVSDNMTNIRFINDHVYGFHGILPEAYFGQSDSLGYEVFDNYSWSHTEIPGFYNISDGAFFNGRLFLSSIGYGIFDTQEMLRIDSMGSNLDGFDPLIPMLATNNDHLYAISFRHEQSLFSLDKEMNLTPYPKSLLTTYYPEGVYMTNGGTLWIDNSIADGGGVITFNPETEVLRYLSSSAGLPSIFIQGIKINGQDEAWVITDDGARIFSDASYITESSNNAYSPIFENQELFNNENLTAIAFDGGDRPWISTSDGLWIFDTNISKVEAFFNTENSPLPSHQIIDMTYNPTNGEMYILTDVGLVSYRSNSSAGLRTHNSVKIFPNPVRPEYDGQVGISGLVQDAYVKITDINGKLIRELETNGGTAAWDLNDYNRKRVKSGVYIVFSSSWDGLESFIGKIAVVN